MWHFSYFGFVVFDKTTYKVGLGSESFWLLASVVLSKLFNKNIIVYSYDVAGDRDTFLTRYLEKSQHTTANVEYARGPAQDFVAKLI